MRGTFVASANESVVSGDVFPYQMQDSLDLFTGAPRLREKRPADDRRYGHRDLEAPQRILYVTSEIADFVKAGGSARSRLRCPGAFVSSTTSAS